MMLVVAYRRKHSVGLGLRWALILGAAMVAAVLLTPDAEAQGVIPLTLTVNSTLDEPDLIPGDDECLSDSGVCTLRAAVEEIAFSANAGPHVINFTLPAGPNVIALGTSLDLFSGPGTLLKDVHINGRSQPGGAATGPKVELRGPNPGAFPAFDLTGAFAFSPVTIEGFAIVGFSQAIVTSDWGGALTVESSYLGLGLDGAPGGSGTGVFDDGQTGDGSFTIGGTTGNGNVISGNSGTGLYIGGGQITVLGNLFGLGPDGTTPQANSNAMIFPDGDNDAMIVEVGDGTPEGRNWIAHSACSGLETGNNLVDLSVKGNVFGLNTAGALAGNGHADACPTISVPLHDGTTGADQLLIGGPDAGDRNFIADGGGTGIQINDVQFGVTAIIRNNCIGTGLDCLSPAGNDRHGIQLRWNAVDVGVRDNVVLHNSWDGIRAENYEHRIQGNTVGWNLGDGIAIGWGAYDNEVFDNFVGVLPGGGDAGNGGAGIFLGDAYLNEVKGNTVGFNHEGIVLYSSGKGGSSDSNWIHGNRVGTDGSGADQGNTCVGIQVSGGSWNVIGVSGYGGSAQGSGNIVAFNHKPECEAEQDRTGIAIEDTWANSYGNTIRRNSIHDNGGLGIDLADFEGDPPSGITPNDQFDSDWGPNGLLNRPVITSVKATSVSGTYHGLTNQGFIIDVYTSPSPDPSGAGEGKTYRGSTYITTDGNGNAQWSFSFGAATGHVTATATRDGFSGESFGIVFNEGRGGTVYPEETSEFSDAHRIPARPPDRVDGCFDGDPSTECILPTSSSSSTTTSSTTTSSSSSTTTTTSSAPTNTGTGTAGPTGSDGLVHKIVIKKDGKAVNSFDGLRGQVAAVFEPADPSIDPSSVCLELVDRDGNVLQRTPPGGGVFDLDQEKSDYYTVRAVICASGDELQTGFRPLSQHALAEQTILVMHPVAEFEPSAQSVVTGIGLIGAIGMIANTVWSRGALFLGEAGKEAFIAVGEDRLRGKKQYAGLSASEAHRRRMIRAWLSFLFAVTLLGIFFALEGAENLALDEFLSVLPIIGLCAFYFFAGQFSLEYLASRASGVSARFRFLISGAVSLVLSTLIFRVAFGYPGYVDEEDAPAEQKHMLGIRALGVFGIMLFLTIPFVAIGRYVDFAFFEEGMAVAVVAISTATLPFPPLPGSDVWRWRPFISLLTIAGAIVMFFGYQLALIAPYVYVIIGVLGLLFYLGVLRWLVVRQQDPLPDSYLRRAAKWEAFKAALEKAKPGFIRSFKAARIRFYQRFQDAVFSVADKMTLAAINRYRRMRGEPPIVRVEENK